MRLKKNCEGCKAFQFAEYKVLCGLGYTLETERDSKDVMHIIRPGEPCPKPRTIREYVRLRSEKDNPA